jgi:hypothetical protein
MTSPFPGMDPYLERHWGDVHTRLIIYTSDSLRRLLPADLRARVEERVFVEAPEAVERSIYPDVRIIKKGEKPARSVTDTGVAVAEPLVVNLADDPITQRYIEIIDVARGGCVITVIEFLSPSNKLAGEGRRLYEKKQDELIRSRVSSVEIDLPRDGLHTLAIPQRTIPASHRTPYGACVQRGWMVGHFEFYAFALRERLPAIRIPLRKDEDDVCLDLQAVIAQCYDNGGYDTIDYRVEPIPPLLADDARWADELLRQSGRR